jgi:hypothetical protein
MNSATNHLLFTYFFYPNLVYSCREENGRGVKKWRVRERRVMKDRAKWMEGEVKSIEPSKSDVFITRAIPNRSSKNQITYDYSTPT